MPNPLLIVAIILAAIPLLIAFILSIKGTITIAYDEEFSVSIGIMFLHFKIYPFKEKRKKHRVRRISKRRAAKIKKKYGKKKKDFLETAADFIKKRIKKKKEAAEVPEEKPEEKTEEKTSDKPKRKLTGEDVSSILDILRLTIELAAITVKRFSKRLTIKVSRLKVTVASQDAATTAIAYGAVTQTINVLLPLLSEVKNFKMPSPKNLSVAADFVSEKPTISMKISFSLRVWHLLDIPLPALIKFFCEIPKYIDRYLFPPKKR